MAVVLTPFRDRETWAAYAVGDEWRGTPERLRELCEGGFVQSGLIAHDADENAPHVRSDVSNDVLADMTIAQLRELAESRGMEVPKRASKSRLLTILGG
jgi:hypothetical protein